MAVGCHAQVMQVTPGARWRHAAPKKHKPGAGPTQRRGGIGGQRRTRRQWASGAHLPPTGAQRTIKGKGGKQRAYAGAAMANGTYGSK